MPKQILFENNNLQKLKLGIQSKIIWKMILMFQLSASRKHEKPVAKPTVALNVCLLTITENSRWYLSNNLFAQKITGSNDKVFFLNHQFFGGAFNYQSA